MTTSVEDNGQSITIDDDLGAFLNEVASGQCLSLAVWATKLLRAGTVTMADVEKAVGLGFLD